jgi:steroid 5-alpha reductase family enzyme
MTIIVTLLLGLVAMAVFFTLIWGISVRLKNAGIIDAFWGPGFVLIAWVYFLLTPEGFTERKLLICILVTIWGLRLGLHIGMRNLGKPEDYRYQNWRKQFGDVWWWQSLYRVFALQGTLLWLIAMPLFLAQYSPGPAQLTLLDWIGAGVWLIGFLFEAVGDWQLTRFKANPANKGKVLNTGLWRYTRHPNYFGDAVVWWGHFLVALATPSGFLTIFSPVMMTFLLRRVSGVTLLEHNLKSTKPGYAEYIRSTNAFIPWFPRSQSSEQPARDQ